MKEKGGEGGRRGGWAFAISLLLLAAVACGAAVPALPSKGGPAWREVQSEHFTLWTDASSARARELVNDMELRRQVIVRAMNRAPTSGKIFAIGLRSMREAQEFMRQDVQAMAWSRSHPVGQPGILFSAQYDANGEMILNHELAHAISDSIVANQPRWFSEALACYFEMASLDAFEGTVEIGVPHRSRLLEVWNTILMPIEDVLACEDGECTSGNFYATSWALFSYLLNEHYDQFVAYQKRLSELDSYDVATYVKVWRESFPGLSPSDIDRDLKEAAKKFKRPRIPVTVKKYQVTERALGDADALAVRSVGYSLLRNEKSIAAFKAALAEEPLHPLAWTMALAWKTPMTLEQARAVTEAHPKDWRAWRLVETLAVDERERALARERGCPLAAIDGSPCRPTAKPRPAD